MTKRTVAYCDRCKKDFKTDQPPYMEHISSNLRGSYSQIALVNNLEDFCPQCTLSFLTWLKAEADKS